VFYFVSSEQILMTPESRSLRFTYNPGQVVHTRVPLFRDAPDPDPDPDLAGYPVDLMDPVRR